MKLCLFFICHILTNALHPFIFRMVYSWYHKQWAHSLTALSISCSKNTCSCVVTFKITSSVRVVFLWHSYCWKWSVSLLHFLLFTPLQPVVSLLFLFVFSLWRDERNDIAGDKIMKGKQKRKSELWTWTSNISPSLCLTLFLWLLFFICKYSSPPFSLTPIYLKHPLPHPIPLSFFFHFLSND